MTETDLKCPECGAMLCQWYDGPLENPVCTGCDWVEETQGMTETERPAGREYPEPDNLKTIKEHTAYIESQLGTRNEWRLHDYRDFYGRDVQFLLGAVKTLLEWNAELTEEFASAVAQECHQDECGNLDSGASATRTDHIRLLERLGWVQVIEERSPRWIVARWAPRDERP